MDQLTSDLKQAKSREQQAAAGIKARAQLLNLLTDKLTGYVVYLDKSSQKVMKEVFT